MGRLATRETLLVIRQLYRAHHIVADVATMAAASQIESAAIRTIAGTNCVNQERPSIVAAPNGPKLRHELHGGAKFSFLKSGSKPSERHCFTSLTRSGGWSAESFFACFVLLVPCFAALTLTSCGSCQ